MIGQCWDNFQEIKHLVSREIMFRYQVMLDKDLKIQDFTLGQVHAIHLTILVHLITQSVQLFYLLRHINKLVVNVD